MMIPLHAYRSPISEASWYKNIPIQYLDEVRRHFTHPRVRIRYRGPRRPPRDTRPLNRRRQDALKRLADRFSVYAPEGRHGH